MGFFIGFRFVNEAVGEKHLGGALVSIKSIGMWVVSDSNGIPTLSNLSAGAYNVMATASDKIPLTIPIVIEVNTTASIIFNLMLVS